MTELKALGRRPVRREVLPPVLAGVALGMAAFTADLVPEAVGRLLVPAFSSGFAWAAVALAVSYYAATLRSALVAGVGTLALATLTYYSLVASLSRQWLSGSAPPPDGLGSTMRASAFWLAGSLLGGLVLGYFAHVLRTGTTRNAGMALGVALGLLAGEAAYTLLYIAFVWLGPMDSFVWTRLGAATVQLLLAAAAALVALRLRRPPVSLRVFLMAAAVATVASIASWHLIESVRMTL
ncbi:DUF6518 family protein [Micromonospora sp. KC723]|uniref:DUF6518 family protein n=1 Tax=Micromonospora sp. KC723 TaxID=2530381 RepID=UPI00104EEFC9|nr:DUF6518 family protein [Micromonospora sp. KC723]TDB72472.1 hypothetical protein E1165_20095 [Micromonospora sp. KC723]